MDNYEQQFKELIQSVKNIETALVGDNLGNKGLVKRVSDIEEKQRVDEGNRNKVVGAFMVVSALIGAGFGALIKKLLY